jgi:hypothetical protein
MFLVVTDHFTFEWSLTVLCYTSNVPKTLSTHQDHTHFVKTLLGREIPFSNVAHVGSAVVAHFWQASSNTRIYIYLWGFLILFSMGGPWSCSIVACKHSWYFMRGVMTLSNVPIVGTPSAECCSKSKFSPRGNSGFISNSRGTVKKSLFILVRQPAKQAPCLASPNPPSGCQAQ